MHLGCWYTFWATDQDSFRIRLNFRDPNTLLWRISAWDSLRQFRRIKRKHGKTRSYSQVVTSCELFSAIYNISKHIVEFMRTATCRLWKSNLLMNLYSWAKISIRLTSQISLLSICGVSIWSSVCRWSCCLLNFLSIPHRQCQDASFPCVYKTTCFKTWHIRQ